MKTNQVTIYKCFVASPSDTQKERKICDKVFDEINRTQGEQLRFRIESKKWERDAIPDFSNTSQEVINNQLLKNYQLFIGIISKSLGVGTEEEFYLAYNSFKNGENIRIMLYFDDKQVKPSLLDLGQMEKIQKFKDAVNECGGLFATYEGVDDFKNQLRQNLQKLFSEKNIGNCNELDQNHSLTLKILENRLDEALSAFSNQPKMWIERTLFKENDNNSVEGDEIELSDIIKSPRSIIIHAPPQFGLTCLSHYLVMKAWEKKSLWLYIDMDSINIHNADPDRIKTKYFNGLELPKDQQMECIILDSWNASKLGSAKILRGLCNKYKDIPLIIMHTMGYFEFISKEDMTMNREFEAFRLSPLKRNSIRKIVSTYNAEKNIGEEDAVLDKLVKDIETLNIHRTPFNCLTLLKVSEKHFDESPLNRTKMIEMVLFTLFDLSEIPTFKSRPDVKDCEYVLGYFCEKILRKNQLHFSRDEFFNEINKFCKDSYIDLDIELLFSILSINRIIVEYNNKLRFRSTYWVYYFSAQRMHANQDFYEHLIKNKHYTKFPEIIEFYTGISRKSTDTIKFLIGDLSQQCDIVQDKMGLEQGLNLMDYMQWNPSEESIQEIEDKINEEAHKSNLPKTLKDDYADKNYDSEKPYYQDVYSVLEEFNFLILQRKIQACSRALRNSDYVEPDIKCELLNQITRGWRLFSEVLFLLTPILAKQNHVSFEGINFILVGFENLKIQDKMNRIILRVSSSVVEMFKDDLFSGKGAPLLYKAVGSEQNKLIKHQLTLLLVFSRPRGWQKQVENYIKSISKNSAYLFDILNVLRNRYKYDFASQKELADMKLLLKMCHGKHEFRGNNLIDQAKQVSDRVIPKRLNNE